jgi:hypothetical protein
VPQQNPPQQQAQQQGWDSGGGGDTGTPWGGTEFPPLNYGSNQDWIKQGPEVFGESSGGSKRWLIIVIVVVVVLGLGAGGYFLFFNNKGTSNANGGGGNTHTSSPATTTTPPKPKDDLSIADLPGTGQDESAIQSFTDVVQHSFLVPSENAAYQAADPTKARIANSSLPNGDNLQVLTVQASSPTAAATAVTALVSLQQTFGMTPFTGTVPAGVQATEIAGSGQTPPTIRAHWVHKDTIVRVQAYGANMASVTQEFNQILAAQLKILPPTNG